jgi:hypothetical protein
LTPKRKSLACNNKTGMRYSGSVSLLGILIAWPWKCQRVNVEIRNIAPASGSGQRGRKNNLKFHDCPYRASNTQRRQAEMIASAAADFDDGNSLLRWCENKASRYIQGWQYFRAI